MLVLYCRLKPSLRALPVNRALKSQAKKTELVLDLACMANEPICHIIKAMDRLVFDCVGLSMQLWKASRWGEAPGGGADGANRLPQAAAVAANPDHHRRQFAAEGGHD